MSFIRFIVLALALLMLSTAPAMASDNVVKLAVTDLEGLEELQREFGPFKDILEKYTKRPFKFYPVSSRTAAVEALRSRKVDFVLTGPAEYVVFKKRTDAEAVVGFSRPDYFCSIIVLADSGIATIKDLKGKKVAFGDVGSTSKHLAPMQVFTDLGLDPLKDVKYSHVSYKVGWEALKRGDVDALATTTDKFEKMRAQEKVLPAGAFKVVARSGDLPNDVLLVGGHVDNGLTKVVSDVFSKHSDELVKAILVGEDNKKYEGMKFLTSVKDSDYDYVRMMYKTIGYPEFAEFVGD